MHKLRVLARRPQRANLRRSTWFISTEVDRLIGAARKYQHATDAAFNARLEAHHQLICAALAVPLDEGAPGPDLEALYADPSTPYWLQSAIHATRDADPVDLANAAEAFAAAARRRADRMLATGL